MDEESVACEADELGECGGELGGAFNAADPGVMPTTAES
jgi:hypothetical protein